MNTVRPQTALESKRRPFMHRWREAVFNSDVPATGKLTLLALAESARQDGSQAFPSASLLARRTSLDEKTCRRALDSLEGSGWFTRKRRMGRSWRLWEYALAIPEGSGTESGPHDVRTGHSVRSSCARTGLSVHEDRTFCPERPDRVPDELDVEPEIEKERTTGTQNVPEAATMNHGKAQTFGEWLQGLQGNGRDLDDVLTELLADADRYAEAVGLPMGDGGEVSFLLLAWQRLSLYHQPTSARNREMLADAGRGARKRSRDWPGEFRRAIEKATGGLWAFGRDGAPYLTTAGRQFAIACGLLDSGSR